jgi:hypothetical protein
MTVGRTVPNDSDVLVDARVGVRIRPVKATI